MRLETNNNYSSYIIRAYNNEGIKVNDELLTKSFIITPDQLFKDWQPQTFSMLQSTDLKLLIDLDPEIIILGSGTKIHFLDTAITTPILESGIGFEVMDSFAACRCYSILVSEGRKAVAGLILEDA